MKNHTSKIILSLLVVSSVFSSCFQSKSEQALDTEEEISVVDYAANEQNEIDILGKRVFELLKTLDSDTPQSIETLLPDFQICKKYYLQKDKTKSYPIEKYDLGIGRAIQNMALIMDFDTIKWNTIQLRDFSYSTYFNSYSPPFTMITKEKVQLKKANFVMGILNFRNNDQNYKIDVFAQKMLDKWYIIRVEKLQEAYTN
jgi:hypothetical protein